MWWQGGVLSIRWLIIIYIAKLLIEQWSEFYTEFFIQLYHFYEILEIVNLFIFKDTKQFFGFISSNTISSPPKIHCDCQTLKFNSWNIERKGQRITLILQGLIDWKTITSPSSKLCAMEKPLHPPLSPFFPIKYLVLYSSSFSSTKTTMSSCFGKCRSQNCFGKLYNWIRILVMHARRKELHIINWDTNPYLPTKIPQ